MSAVAPPPFAGLTPDCILQALEGLDLPCNGSLLALNSYENRVYQVGQEDGPPLIAKFYRPARWSDEQILEEHALTAELDAQQLQVVTPLRYLGTTLHTHAGFRFAVFPRRGGRAPALDQPGTLAWMGRFLGRIHSVAALRPFAARPALTLERLGRASLDYLARSDDLPPELVTPYLTIAGQALEAAAAAWERAGAVAQIRLHGDCHPGNVLWTDAGPHFVDFDDCCSGPAVQDLWMLLSGDRAEQRQQLTELLTGYEAFCDFDPRELHLVEALRTLRLIYYSAWLARRWHDPAFPVAFPWFATPRYWQDRILELREQVALLAEPPLWPV
jgi:Ser/Thr protein kinase RdoA (MazF antagonist)